LNGVAVSSSQINLSWTDNSGNEDGFSIERCTNNNCTNFAQIAQVGPNVTTFNNTGLSGNKFYRYRVRAFNVSGNSAYSNIIQMRTPK
jgi:fibronectin type III domain protein